MNVVIVGAHGQIALALAHLLTARGDRVAGVIRNEEHVAELEARGIDPVQVDLEAARARDALLAAFDGADAIVFAAGAGPGSGPERKITVDHGGAVLSAEAAMRAGVRRMVVVSAARTDDPPSGDDDMSVYLRAKRDADVHVRESGLAATIVRPVSLTNGAATGRVRIARHVDGGEVPRADVARVLAEVLRDDATIGRTFEVTGGDTPIADAVGALGEQGDTLVS